MKRILSLILCLFLLVSFVSCKKGAESENESAIQESKGEISAVSTEENLGIDESDIVGDDDSSDASQDSDDESSNPEDESSNDDVSNDEEEEEEKEENENDESSTDNPDTDDEDDKDNGDKNDDKGDDKDDNKDDTPTACQHKTTKIINKKDATTSSEGYTGDKVCSDCGTLIEKGESIPKIKENPKYITYTNAYGDKITVTEDVDVFQYTLAQANKTATSEAADIEAEILRLTNIERVNAGLQPLKNETGAYYFAKLRAQECHELFSHTRPNGQGFYTVFCDEKVFYVYAGENLAKGINMEYDEIASGCVEGWMNSEGHRANILNPKFTSIAIATVIIGNTQCSVQLFFGKND